MGKQKQSVLWNYFNPVDESTARCKICNHEIKYRSSTSNLKKHLLRRHPSTDLPGINKNYVFDKIPKIEKNRISSPASSSSVSAITDKHKRQRSHLWNFFHSIDDNKAICNFCSHCISHKTSTSNLKRHLLAKHASEVHISSESLIGIKDCESTFAMTNSNHQEEPCATIEFVSVSPEQNRNTCINNTSTIKQSKLTYVPKVLDNHNKTKIDKCLLKLFTHDFQPFSFVESEGFKNFVKELNPSYELPSKKAIVDTLFPSMFEETYSKVQRLVKDARFVTITTECWKSVQTENFVAVTAYFITENFEIKSALIECISYYEEYTSSNLAVEIKRILEEWGLGDKVCLAIIDNDHIVKDAVTEELNWQYFECYAKTLNIIVKDGLNIVESLITKLRGFINDFKCNTTAYEQLCSVQTLSGRESKKLIQDMPSKWNTTFSMIKRFVELEETMSVVYFDNNSPIFTIEEWQLLKDIKKVLEPMESIIKIMSEQKLVSISSIIILTNGLEKVYLKLEKYNMSPLAQSMAVQFLEEIHKHFGNVEENEILITSTFLDPRFKNVGFSDVNVAHKAQKIVEHLVAVKIEEIALASKIEIEIQESSNENCSVDNSGYIFSVWSHFDEKAAASQPITTHQQRAEKEVQRYLEDSLLDRHGDPLVWWREHAFNYPYLKEVVIEKFGPTATSVPCDRLYSKMGQILYDRRSYLSSGAVKHLVFINGNK